MAKYVNKSKLMGKIGTENYKVSNCPFHLPKENVDFFKKLQDAGNEDPFRSETYHNQVEPDWKKKIQEAVKESYRKSLNESNGCRTDEECLRANLVCLYDHCDQQNFYILKNPTVEDIKEIGEYHNRYYYKEKNPNPKDRIVAEFLEWAYYNIKLDGLTCIEYDDENVNLCSFDFNDDKELYKFVYKAYSKDEAPLKSDASGRRDFSEEARIDYVLNIISQNILNQRDHYGFGIGIRLSFIEYFFKDYKEILDRYNNGDKEGDPDWLKRIKEKEKILSSYQSFVSYMKSQVKNSFCNCDSGSATILLNLKTEQIFEQGKAKIHFIKSFKQYKDEMYKILTKEHKIKESQEFDFNFNSGLLFEGAWGYKPAQSDSYLDDAHHFAEPIIKALLKGLKSKDVNDVYYYMGYTNECLRMHNVMGETLYWKPGDEESYKTDDGEIRQNYGIQLINAFNKAYELLNEKYKELGWSKPEKFLKELKNVKEAFDKLMEERNTSLDDKTLEKHRKIWKERHKLFYEKDDDDKVSEQYESNSDSGLLFEGEFGGVSGCYNTPMNTLGVGDVVLAGQPAMTASQQASDAFNGSGDLAYPGSYEKFKKKGKKKSKKKSKGIQYFPIAIKK